MEQVVARENMLAALKRVERNGGAPGVDGVPTERLRDQIRVEWERIREELLRGTYRPQPVRRVEIPKPGGGKRMLGIPTVMDRLIQQALLQVLTPIFDPTFSESSYGFRPGRRGHDAVRKARQYVEEGYDWVVDMDLEKFFDRVNHDVLMARVARRVTDKRVLRLIRGVVPEIVEIQSGGPQAPFGITGVDSRKEVAATDVIVPREDQEAPVAGGGQTALVAPAGAGDAACPHGSSQGGSAGPGRRCGA
ncbi:reverse transcriptase domain-containing protein [Symbiobacterium thermophilum]|uniref:Reverse transcriptase domain-containing protein n=1 Tax=Symbiobacterium thermophilum (strain DSM 24528 / JCM 14929 / IAM 14863 / T) TaxID=292459 RepID=Q67M30_SYMTH|nr:unnamed protein product [Symbiobacterium thermophilum IAM 14863]